MLLVLISWLGFKQSVGQPLPVTIQQQAYKAVQASLKRDYQTLLTYTYPRLIELSGGPQKMLVLMKQQPSPPHHQAIHVQIEQPGLIYKAGKELHVLVPYVLTISRKPTSLRLRAYQLAVSTNQGKHWYFLPTDLLTKARIHTLFPSFNPRLKLPQPEPSIIGQP